MVGLVRASLLACLVVALPGCGGAPATVSGTVTIDGKAYEGLRVSFIPEAGGATATSTTNADGSFTVMTGQGRGLEVGEYRVTVKGFSATPGPMMSKEEVDALRVVPKESSNRQKTPHRATVNPGDNQIDLEI